MGHSFSLWANVSSALCVSLHLAFISVSCSRSLFFFFPRRSSQLGRSKRLCPRHRNVQCLWLSRRGSSSVLSSGLSLLAFCELSTQRESLFVCGLRSDLLWAGLDQLSCQAAAGDPPRLFVTVQVWQAETLPAHHRPLRVHQLQLLLGCTEGDAESLWFILHIKKDKNRFWKGPQCNLWWRCIARLQTTWGSVIL